MKKGIIALISLALVLTACDTTITTGSDTGRILPNVTGGAGEVLVVMDTYLWDGSSGELLKDVLKEQFPALSSNEPLFDVVQVSTGSFQKVTRFHRSVVLVTLNENTETPTIRYRKNVWSKPQIVVQIEAKSSKDLYTLINDNKDQIQRFLVQYDRQRLADSYEAAPDLEMQKLMAENHSLRLSLPRGYNVDVSSDDYTSVSIEAAEYSQVIQVYEYPATGPEDLNSEALLEKRNEFSKKYVKGPREGSFMTTSKVLPPLYSDLTIAGKKVVEMRGLWELENAFMGGPFVSHSIYDSTRNRIVTVEGYIYFPNQKKRVKVRQIEAIVYSAKFF